MATTTNSGLQPPLVRSIQPAQTGDSMRIYFQLSDLNTADDIKQVQIILKLQENNKTAFNTSTYPQEIKLSTLNLDNKGYYIILNKSELATAAWQSNIQYKLQLRFSTTAQESPLSAADLATGVANNYYSEWSSVCLLRHISSVTVAATGVFYDGEYPNSSDPSDQTYFSARVSFNDDEETDCLNSYRVRVQSCDYSTSNGISYQTEKELLEDSGTISAEKTGSSKNQMSYKIKTSYQTGLSQSIIVDYTTVALFTGQTRYYFTVSKDFDTQTDVSDFSTYADEENGSIILYFKLAKANDIIIRRSSSRQGYLKYDELITLTPSATDISKGSLFGWADQSVESGVFYKYQIMNSAKNAVVETDPVMVLFDNAYLLTKRKQLTLKYDTKISSYKETVLESVTNTIGGTYPFVRQNGNVRYKQFSLSGLISKIADSNDLFGTEDEILATQWQNSYDEQRKEHRILPQNDYVLEREFREQVLQFLTDGKPKLFKSLTEGNMLVVLQGVSLSPNEVLGRLIYTFSATAYEVADTTVENLSKQDIIMDEAYIAESAKKLQSYPSVFHHESGN